MAQYPVLVSPQCAPPAGPSQQVPQTIIVSLPQKSNRREHFKDRYALIIGIILICAASVAIILNSVGIWTYEKRASLQHHSSSQGYYVFPSFWASVLVYLTGSFAIVASKTKRVGYIITCMIFGILAAVIMVPFFATVSWIIAYERREHTIRPWYQYTYNGSNSQTESPERYSQLISLDKAGLALGVSMLICGLIMFVSSITLSALCCRAVCCCNKNTDVPPDTSQVVFLNTPSGVQMSTVLNHQSYTSIGDQAGQAVGGDLPPSYSTTEINKVGLADQQAGECPTKVQI